MDKKKTVLIVDDDPFLLTLADEILNPVYSVSLAKSGQQAIDYINRGNTPDIILLDVLMPSMDGFETINQLRHAGKEGSAKNIPVVFLTSVSDVESEVRGLKMGAVDYITKPFKRSALLTRINLHLSGHEPNTAKFKHSVDISHFNPEKVLQTESILNPIEAEIAKMISTSYTNQEIGTLLDYSYYYVIKIISGIFKKFKITKRIELLEKYI